MAKKKQEEQVEEKNVESTVKDDKIRVKKPSLKKILMKLERLTSESLIKQKKR